MSRSLSSKSTLDVLKQDAKRWLKALRSGDTVTAEASRRRLRDAWPTAPDEPTLRDVQHALAREYGLADWRTLLAALDELALERQSHAERVRALLEHGWNGNVVVARRIASRFPEVRRDSLFTAAACGEVELVSQLLAANPELARATHGERGWSALHYVTYSRIDTEHAVTIARLLLDAGADPNARFDDGWGSPFTVLTGAIRLGEGARPSHAQAEALVELLVSRGADPFDTQALYNTSIVRDDVFWTELLWTQCERQGRTALWSATEGPVLNGPIKIGTLNYLLGNAVANNHLRRAEWLLSHGASATTLHGYTRQSVHTLARLAGYSRMADLLVRHGAQAETLQGERALIAAIMDTGAEHTVREMVANDPSLLRSPMPLHTAAMHGRASGVKLLLSLGADVNAVDHAGVTALHRAAHAGAIDTIDALLAAGADVNQRDSKWHSTPLGWAVALKRPFAADRLAQVSQDVRSLARSGRVARLTQVLQDAPAFANHTLHDVDDPTPLFCLPDDETEAFEVTGVLLAHGANPLITNRAGKTPEQTARLRGLDEAADLMVGS